MKDDLRLADSNYSTVTLFTIETVMVNRETKNYKFEEKLLFL